MMTATKANAASAKATAERAARGARAAAPAHGGASRGRLATAKEGARAETPQIGVTVDRKDPQVLGVKLIMPPDGLREFGGGREWEDFNKVLVTATLKTIALADPAGMQDRVVAACAALAAFKPTNEIEGMIAGQAVALHHAAMECLRLAMNPGQPFEIATRLRKDGANMARGMTDMLDAMDRRRGKGPQVVRVERVVVHEGGQAIVGTVSAAAGIHGRVEGG